MTFNNTIQLFKADVLRRLLLENKQATFWSIFRVLFKRGVVLVLIYRLKRYLYLKNSKPLKMLIWLLRLPEYQYCHSEIDPQAEIDAGLVLTDLGGIGIGFYNIIGKNCTFIGRATPTLGAMEDVNHHIDRIRIGDYCVIGTNVRIINPVTIADGTQIKANSVVMTSFTKKGSLISGFPAKEIAVLPMDAIVKWSPLSSKPIHV